jgi:Tfp pilus assembly protein PilZ
MWNPMTELDEPSRDSSVTARLKGLAEDIRAFIDKAPEDRQRILLSLLEDHRLQDLLKDWQHGQPKGTTRRPVSALMADPKGDRILKDFIGDIGTGGMFIETPPTFSVGEEVTLVFSPTYEQGPVRVTGKIVWRIPSGIGIRFTSATNDLEEILKSL